MLYLGPEAKTFGQPWIHRLVSSRRLGSRCFVELSSCQFECPISIFRFRNHFYTLFCFCQSYTSWHWMKSSTSPYLPCYLAAPDLRHPADPDRVVKTQPMFHNKLPPSHCCRSLLAHTIEHHSLYIWTDLLLLSCTNQWSSALWKYLNITPAPFLDIETCQSAPTSL